MVSRRHLAHVAISSVIFILNNEAILFSIEYFTHKFSITMRQFLVAKISDSVCTSVQCTCTSMCQAYKLVSVEYIWFIIIIIVHTTANVHIHVVHTAFQHTYDVPYAHDLSFIFQKLICNVFNVPSTAHIVSSIEFVFAASFIYGESIVHYALLSILRSTNSNTHKYLPYKPIDYCHIQ